MITKKKVSFFYKTKSVLLWTSCFNEPLATLYSWLPFIFRKDLGATPFQIMLLISIRPLISLVSFYWSSNLSTQKSKLRSNLVLSGLLSRIPFLCFFFLDNVWFLLLASAIHIFFSKGGIPAWMEILKLNLPRNPREKLFSFSAALGYLEGIFLAIAVGSLLDFHSQLWKYLFFFSALIGILSVFLQSRLPIRNEDTFSATPDSLPLMQKIIQPWKNSISLMRSRPDFAHFQWGFMFGGLGIMATAAALPLFFVDTLHLSHLTFTTSRSICMGLGFILSSSLWAKALSRFPIASITGVICFGFGLFPLFLLLANLQLFWIYPAYILYGIAQGGSHLIWHLSGPLFANEEDSSRYSGVNIVMVGLRGLIAPFLSNLICLFFGPLPVLFLGVILCCSGGMYMFAKKSALREMKKAS
ncbi:MAG: MFS transporter [Chlamydiota bacterium]